MKAFLPSFLFCLGIQGIHATKSRILGEEDLGDLDTSSSTYYDRILNAGTDEEANNKEAEEEFIPTGPEQLGVCDSTSCTFDKRDWTSREGLGESPGVPSLEYLGLGYDILYGNPRGSDSGELDPGFRSQVMLLPKDLSITTFDEVYSVPVGVELKYIPTCNFDSKSTEISSFEQYQTQLSKETTTETSFSLGALIPIKALQFGLGASLKFSKSEKSMSFQQSSEQTKSVTFEARAICTEFDASLKPFFNKGSSSDSTGYGDSSSTGSSRTRSRSHTHSHHGNSSSTSSSRTRSHTHSRSAEPDTEPEPPSPRIRSNTHSVSTEFADAVECLPQPGSFNTSNPLHVEAYDDFLRAFGTHFVRRVILGGKLIKSTSLNSRDVLELSKESVQVEESLSFGAQFALGSPSYVKDSLAGDGETSSSQVTVNNNCADKGGPDDAVAGAADEKPEAGGNFGFSYSEFSRTSKESESLSKISERDFKTSETTVGGDPPIDGNWKSWAASVRSRPMPIMYDLQGIWNLFDNEQLQEDFFTAVELIYDINLNPDDNENKILEPFHFGVSDPEGNPISAYTLNPAYPFRALLQIDSIQGEDSVEPPPSKEEEPKSQYTGGVDWLNGGEYVGNMKFGHFVCGVAVDSDYDDAGLDAEGIMDVGFEYCDSRPSKFNNDNKAEVVGYVRLAPDHPFTSDVEYFGIGNTGEYARCAKGEYVYSMRMKHDNDKIDEIGMHALEMRCRKPGSTEVGEPIRVYCNEDGDHDDGRLGNCDEDAWEAWSKETTDFFVTAGRVKVDGGTNGLEALGLQLRKHTDLFPPISEIQTYVIVPNGPRNIVTPYFAQMIRGTVSKNGLEDKAKGILDRDGKSLVVERVAFGLGAEPMPKFGVTDFKNGIRRRASMPNFCYLTADNLRTFAEEKGIISGIVHPDGYPLNDPAEICFEIAIDQCSDGHDVPDCYTIEFEQSFSSPATLIVFPVWFTGQGVYPEDSGDLAVAVVKGDCTVSSCAVQLGTNNGVGLRRLGFSFLAIDGDLSQSPLVHGRVIGAPNGENSNLRFKELGKSWDIDANQSNCQGCESMESKLSEMEGFSNSATMTKCQDNNDECIWGFDGGVIIKFDSPFKEIPSVIATPIFDDVIMHDRGIDKFTMPFCVIEYITKEETFIKCGKVDTISDPHTFSPISFYFVAVGPASRASTNRAVLRSADREGPSIINSESTTVSPSSPPSAPPSSFPITQTPSEDPSNGPTFNSERTTVSPSTQPSDPPSPFPKTQTPSEDPSNGPTFNSERTTVSPSSSPSDPPSPFPKTQTPSEDPSNGPTFNSERTTVSPSSPPSDPPSPFPKTQIPSEDPSYSWIDWMPVVPHTHQTYSSTEDPSTPEEHVELDSTEGDGE